MTEERLIINITKSGEVTVKVEGHPGKGCKELSADVEEALGKVTADSPTQEMRAPSERTSHRSTQRR